MWSKNIRLLFPERSLFLRYSLFQAFFYFWLSLLLDFFGSCPLGLFFCKRSTAPKNPLLSRFEEVLAITHYA